MDKRGARILLGCLAGTVIVVLLILLASRLTQPSCELIIMDPTQFKSAAIAEWSKGKPFRSHDKSTLFKISAYLEYNIQQPSGTKDKSQNASATQFDGLVQTLQEQKQQESPSQQQQQQQQPAQQHGSPANAPTSQQQQQPLTANQLQVQQAPGQASSGQQALAMANGQKSPTPSLPQIGFTNQQMASGSMQFGNTTPANSDSKSEKARFLPLELEDFEMKKLDDNKFSYTLNFNCSTMKMILVKKSDRVYFEKITMELKPKSQKKSSCELKSATPEIFSVETQPGLHDGWARYHCDKSIKYSCYHNSSKHPSEPGILLAELHINAIEFETTSLQLQSNKTVHQSRDFLGTRGKSCA